MSNNNNLPVITNEEPIIYRPSTRLETELITFEVSEMQAKKLESLPVIYKNDAKTVFGLLNLNENINIQIIELIGKMHENYKKSPIKDGKKTVGFNDFINAIYEEYIDKDKISRFVGIYTYLIKEPYFDKVRDVINSFSYSNLVTLYQYIKKEPAQKAHVMDLINDKKLTAELTHKAFINVLTAIEVPNGTGANANGTGANANGTGDNGTGDNGTGDNGTGDNGTGDNGTGDNGTGDNGTGDNGTNDITNDRSECTLDNGICYVKECVPLKDGVFDYAVHVDGLTEKEMNKIIALIVQLDMKRKK